MRRKPRIFSDDVEQADTSKRQFVTAVGAALFTKGAALKGMEHGQEKASADLGIPYQKPRYILPHGTEGQGTEYNVPGAALATGALLTAGTVAIGLTDRPPTISRRDAIATLASAGAMAGASYLIGDKLGRAEMQGEQAKKTDWRKTAVKPINKNTTAL